MELLEHVYKIKRRTLSGGTEQYSAIVAYKNPNYTWFNRLCGFLWGDPEPEWNERGIDSMGFDWRLTRSTWFMTEKEAKDVINKHKNHHRGRNLKVLKEVTYEV